MSLLNFSPHSRVGQQEYEYTHKKRERGRPRPQQCTHAERIGLLRDRDSRKATHTDCIGVVGLGFPTRPSRAYPRLKNRPE